MLDKSRVLLRLSSVVVVVGLSLIILREPTQACECEEIDGSWTVADELERSELVFRGIVTSIESPFGGEVGFSVVTVWKGPIAAHITIWTGSGGGDCGYEFQEGVEYVVYVHSLDEGYVGICSETAPVELAKDDLFELGSGVTPDPEHHPPARFVPGRRTPPPPPADRTWIYVLAGFAIYAGLLGAIWLFQRRRRLRRIVG